MMKIGLTGGIGCGKTTVARLFEEKGIPVIDADEIAHELVCPGQPALTEIARAFGEEMLNADGSLNRRRMRTEIFRSRASKKTLESILHPRVYAEIERRLETLDAPYAILSIPLLIETRQQARVDRILVVDCPLQLQYERVEARDCQDTKEIGRIISSQASRDERLRFADEIIVNDSSIDNLAEQVNKIHLLYVSLSSSSPKMPS